MSFTVVTDTVSDLPERLAATYDIPLLPVNIRFGRRVYKDRFEISPEEFYSLLSVSKIHPITTPPTPVFAYKFFLDLLQKTPEVLFISVASGVSRTYNNCKIASEFIREGHLELFDSLNLSIGQGLMAIYAAMMREAGLLMGQVVRKLERIRTRSYSLVQPADLTYLERSGRVDDAIQLFIGKTFKVQPILAIDTSGVHAEGATLSFKKGIEKMIESLKEKYEDEEVLVGVMDAGNATWADMLEQRANEELNAIQIIRTKLGPSMGAHVGPNSIGIAVVPFEPIE